MKELVLRRWFRRIWPVGTILPWSPQMSRTAFWDHAIILTLTTVATEMIICFDLSMTNTGISSLQFFVMLRESFKKQTRYPLNKSPGNPDSRGFCLGQALTLIPIFTFRLVATWLREANLNCQKAINFRMIWFSCLWEHHGPRLKLSWAVSTGGHGFLPRTFHFGRTETQWPHVGSPVDWLLGEVASRPAVGLHFVLPALVLLTTAQVVARDPKEGYSGVGTRGKTNSPVPACMAD